MKYSTSSSSLQSMVGRSNAVLMDYRPSWEKLITKKVDRLFSDSTEYQHIGLENLRKMVTRLLLNPTPDVIQYLYQFKQRYYTNHTVLGVQVRLGGCLANSHEIMMLMTLEQFRSLPNMIRQHINSTDNPVVYLSTDSDIAERYFREKLPDVRILTSSSLFSRHHSTGMVDLSIVKSSLVDLFLLADADVLLISDSSKFGRMADYMTRARKITRIRYKRTLINRDQCDKYLSTLQL